jgi:hypothetical protein
MVDVQRRLADMLRKHGMLCSEIFQLSSTEAFEGFTNLAKTMMLANLDDEDEIWVKMEYYRDRRQMDDVSAKVVQDANAGPLFRQVFGLVSQAYGPIMGQLSRMSV